MSQLYDSNLVLASIKGTQFQVAVSSLTFGPIGLFALGFAVLPGLRTWALGLDRRFLIGIHAMRTAGVSFLFLYLYGVLPAAFAVPAGFGDLIAAVWDREADPVSSATEVAHVRS